MRLSTSTSTCLLFCLALVPVAAPGLGCGGDDPPTVPSKKGTKGGSSGAAGAAGSAGVAGAEAAGAAGATAAGAAGATAAGAAGATAAGAAGATGAGASGAAGAGAGGAAAGSAGAAAAGASGASAAGNGGAGGMVKPKGTASVEIFAGKESASKFRNAGNARFIQAPAEGATSPCATTDLAGTNCKVEACTALPTTDVIESAGSIDVQVAGASGPETKMKLVYKMANKSYEVDETMYKLPTDAAIYAGGQKLTLLATGFEAPGFATEIVAPGILTLTSPAPGNVGQPISIDTKVDLPLTFSGSGNGALEIRIESSKKDNPNVYTKLVCSFPAGAAGAKIPQAALAKLPPIADVAQYNTSLNVLTVASAPVDNLKTYTIAIRATTHVLDGSGVPWGPQQVTLK